MSFEILYFLGPNFRISLQVFSHNLKMVWVWLAFMPLEEGKDNIFSANKKRRCEKT